MGAAGLEMVNKDKNIQRKIIIICLILIGTLLAYAPLRGEEGPGGNIAIIVSTGWEKAKVVDTNELKIIFLGKKRYFMGKKVKPLQRKPGLPIRDGFIKNVLRMNERDLKEYWIAEQLKGGAIPPRSTELVDSVVKYVVSVEGAISYADPGELKAEHLKKVKVLNLKHDGKIMQPSDPGYILKY
jgi:hypothetical protein